MKWCSLAWRCQGYFYDCALVDCCISWSGVISAEVTPAVEVPSTVKIFCTAVTWALLVVGLSVPSAMALSESATLLEICEWFSACSLAWANILRRRYFFCLVDCWFALASLSMRGLENMLRLFLNRALYENWRLQLWWPMSIVLSITYRLNIFIATHIPTNIMPRMIMIGNMCRLRFDDLALLLWPGWLDSSVESNLIQIWWKITCMLHNTLSAIWSRGHRFTFAYQGRLKLFGKLDEAFNQLVVNKPCTHLIIVWVRFSCCLHSISMMHFSVKISFSLTDSWSSTSEN